MLHSYSHLDETNWPKLVLSNDIVISSGIASQESVT